jgi:hypothetical protein
MLSTNSIVDQRHSHRFEKVPNVFDMVDDENDDCEINEYTDNV